jgi:serine/threonine protein kinase
MELAANSAAKVRAAIVAAARAIGVAAARRPRPSKTSETATVFLRDRSPIVGLVTNISPILGVTGSDNDYGFVLGAARLAYERRGVWLHVGNGQRLQGWKLHLSTTPAQAEKLFKVVMPLLAAARAIFKCTASRSILIQLNGGELGETQVGKAVTIYPRDDDEAERLARDLQAATTEFEGPEIATDLRLGGIVYTRYGGFNPRVIWDRLGQSFAVIEGQDGRWHRDEYKVPFCCPEAVVSPYNVRLRAAACDPPVASLLNGRYFVLDVVKPSLLGSVFRALDIQDGANIAVRIVKQGRPHCHSDELGRDARTRLQHQEYVQRALATLPGVPRTGRYFQADNIGYLPMEYVEGRTVEVEAVSSLRSRSWAALDPQTKVRLLDYVRQLNTVVLAIHSAGFVHRDIAANNVWIGRDEKVYVIDFEMAYELAGHEMPFGLGTAGFMSPNQLRRGRPQKTDDAYAIASVLVLLLTGIDPRRIVHGSRDAMLARLLHLTGLSDSYLLDWICTVLSTSQPENSPSLEDLVAAVEKEEARSMEGTKRAPMPCASTGPLESVVASGLRYVAAELDTQITKFTTAVHHIAPPNLFAHRGIAGAVYLLARAARVGVTADGSHSVVRRGVEVLMGQHDEDPVLPGLYFGRAGMALAVAEAIGAGLADDSQHARTSIRAMLSGKLDWPDVTHGAAGQGLAALYCDRLLHNAALGSLAHRCAEYLVSSQQPDGSWIMPEGVDGMSGEILTGFAHGAAGIVYFLCDYDRRYSVPDARRSWQRGYAWLAAKACRLPATEAVNWEYSDKNREMWRWWCHGAPGVALALLRLIEAGYWEVVDKDLLYGALRLHPTGIRYANLSQCHGLAGLAEIYLEAHRVLREREWRDRAMEVVETLLAMRKEQGDSIKWIVEEIDPNSELMVGSAGVLHLLLRALKGSAVLGGFPLLGGPY